MRGSIGFLAATSLLLSACATIPPPLRGDFADVSTIDASTGAFDGTPARWGGVVASIRVTDNGECAEVGWYPLDRFTSRPQLGPVDGSAYGNPNVHRSVFPGMLGVRGIVAAPRFLACGESVQDNSRFFPGAVVTLAGTIAPAKIYQVAQSDCMQPGNANSDDWIRTIYSGTMHTIGAKACIVSLPTLQVVRSHGWKEQPQFDPNSSSAFHGY